MSVVSHLQPPPAAAGVPCDGAAFTPLSARLAVSGGLCALYVIVLLGLYHTYIGSWQQYDDAYITYRYAVNLATGKGLVFNHYERVNSASSLLYTLALAGCYRVGLTELEKVATVINVGSALGVIWLMGSWILQLTRSTWRTVVLIAPICISGSLCCWSVSGMETVFYALLVLLFLRAYFCWRSDALAGVCLAACVLTRVEGLILVAAIVAAQCLARLFDGRRGDRRFRVCLACGASAAAAYLAFNLWYFGALLPHSLHFKQVASYYRMGCVLQFLSVENFYWSYFPVIFILGWGLLLPGAVAMVRQCDGGDRRLLWALGGYIVLSFASFVVGPHSDYQRYTIHIIPILGIAAALSLTRLVPCFAVPRGWIGLGLCVVLVLGCYRAGLNQLDSRKRFLRSMPHQLARRQVGRWIRANVPPGELVVSADLGAIAYAALEHDFVDAIGLTTRAPVQAVRAGQWSRMMTWLARRRPAYAADTVYADGEIYALHILRQPACCFLFPNSADAETSSLPDTTTLYETRAGSLRYRVARLDWPAADVRTSGLASQE